MISCILFQVPFQGEKLDLELSAYRDLFHEDWKIVYGPFEIHQTFFKCNKKILQHSILIPQNVVISMV